ncbi:MAG: TRAP transporter substrate-binding protein DctP [Rhodospirillaceae bacterium]
MNKPSVPIALCVAAVALAGALSDARAEVRKLTILSASPVTVTPTAITKEFFVPEINRRLAASGHDFKIEWNESYGPNLAKFTEILESVEEGIAHIGVLLRNFEESKLPLDQYPSFIPFGIMDPQKMPQVDDRVRAKVPELDQAYLKFNQILLARGYSHSAHVFTTFPVKTVGDMKGHKVGISGANGHVLRGTGAVPVTANMAQSYVDIKNGVYEGYVISELNAFPYRTFEVATQVARTWFGVSSAPAVVVNKKTWDALPAFARDIVRAVADQWHAEYYKFEKRKMDEWVATMTQRGVKFTDLSLDERRQWARAMPNVGREWAADMDKLGLPGSRVLTAYMDEVRASGDPIVREWDKE